MVMEVGLGVGLTAAGLMAYRYLVSPRLFGLKVNCWFCQSDDVVDFGRKNGWKCGNCDQYNGFTKDGDYNWQDPDKYVEVNSKGKTTPAAKNNLCHACNLNQSLKVQQLASFTPHNEANFEAEIEEYAKHLQRTYRLCRKCEAALHQTLGEQDSWIKPKLLSWRLEKNRFMPNKKEHHYNNNGDITASNRRYRLVGDILRLLLSGLLLAQLADVFDLISICLLLVNLCLAMFSRHSSMALDSVALILGVCCDAVDPRRLI